MTLSKYEQETIISFNQEEHTANIYTMNRKLQRQLHDLASERENAVQYRGENGFGAQTYVIPKSWVRIRAPRVLSEQQRSELAERARRNFGHDDSGGDDS